MNELEKLISKMDFQYFGTGQHKISPEDFLKKKMLCFWMSEHMRKSQQLNCT